MGARHAQRGRLREGTADSTPLDASLKHRRGIKTRRRGKRTLMFAPIRVALTTGARRGELLGFTWRDFDEKAATSPSREPLSKRAAS
jgi:integrase